MACEPHLRHLNPITYQKSIKKHEKPLRFSSKRFVCCYKSAEKAYFKPKNNNPNFLSKLGLYYGGEGGIRTLEPLLTVTRFPIVRARPATRLLRVSKYFFICRKYTLSSTAFILYHSKHFLSIYFSKKS